MAAKNVDWIAIEGAYRAGVDSLRTIAGAHGLSEAAIRKAAKKNGWSRDPTGTKRAIVNAHMASSSQGGTQEGAQCAQEQIAAAANEDIRDMESGLRVHRACLERLETAVKRAADKLALLQTLKARNRLNWQPLPGPQSLAYDCAADVVHGGAAGGGKPPIVRSTMNVRDDNLGKSPLYGPAWRAGRRCLIPADWIYEPCYETGKNVWHRIGLVDWRTMCVAGIWRTLQGQDGVEHHTMSMITVNGEGHPVFSRMHKPDDEKRAVVILRPDDCEEWLTTSNVDAARAMLQFYPADEMVAAPK